MTPTPSTRFYDANAAPLQLAHRDVDDPNRYGQTMRVVALWSHTPGCEPVVVELDEVEACALAEAIIAGFATKPADQAAAEEARAAAGAP